VAILFIVSSLVALAAWRQNPPGETELPGHGNPSELRPAILFGLLYGLVLLAVAAAKEHLGPSGLYAVAVLSGLTDMDAITLSTGRLIQQGRLDPGTGWRLIVVASLANLAFKFGIVAVLGQRSLMLRVGVLFAVLGAASGALLLFWPL
jgi:uncharacterized membrane protein (DUF4010 family)